MSTPSKLAIAAITLAAHSLIVSSVLVMTWWDLAELDRPHRITVQVVPPPVIWTGASAEYWKRGMAAYEGISTPQPERQEKSPRSKTKTRETSRARKKSKTAPAAASPSTTPEASAPKAIASRVGSSQGKESMFASSGAANGTPGAGRNITPPVPLKDYASFKVPWSKRAERERLVGSVLVRLRIDTKGRVSSVRLLRGIDHELDGQALVLARALRFRPARANGEAIAVFVHWTFHVGKKVRRKP